jgi:proline iminopeptidase
VSPKERRIEIRKTAVHVVDSARRGLLPVLAVHGFPGADHMSLRMTPGFENLAGRTRLVYYDQRGAGYSEGWLPDTQPSLAQHVTDLYELINALNLERPIVIGHNAGGRVALGLALEHPAAASGVVLVCSRHAREADDHQEFETKIAEMLEDVDVAGLFEIGDRDPDIALRDAMEKVFPLGFLRFGLSERTFMKAVTFRRQAYDDQWRMLASDDPDPPLAALRVPVLVMAGRYDPFVDLSQTRELAEAIPGARFQLFHNSAHWPFIEEPELFADEIWTWMEEVAAHIL